MKDNVYINPERRFNVAEKVRVFETNEILRVIDVLYVGSEYYYQLLDGKKYEASEIAPYIEVGDDVEIVYLFEGDKGTVGHKGVVSKIRSTPRGNYYEIDPYCRGKAWPAHSLHVTKEKSPGYTSYSEVSSKEKSKSNNLFNFEEL